MADPDPKSPAAELAIDRLPGTYSFTK